MTAEQFKNMYNLVTDAKEIEKVKRWMLGVAESDELKRERLHEMLDTKEEYKIKKIPRKRVKKNEA